MSSNINSSNELSNENETTIIPEDKRPKSFRAPIKWSSFLFIAGFHILSIAGFFTFSWSAFWIFVALYFITACLGITIGYHRLLTHQSFKTSKWLTYLLAIFGSLACQGGPLMWVATHRIHHARSDQPGDPHSPNEGFFWSHMGWCIRKDDELDNRKVYYRYVPDLTKDPVMVFLNEWFLIWTAFLAAALYLWGGWSFVVWGIFIRTIAVYHSTWFVNSASHIWGYQNYKSSDDAKNLWWVALLTFGEGWHNNHHAFQTSARHGLKWWEFDATYLVILFLKNLGLAREIKLPTAHQIALKTQN